MDVSSVPLMDPLYSLAAAAAIAAAIAAPLAHYRCPKHTPTARYTDRH